MNPDSRFRVLGLLVNEYSDMKSLSSWLPEQAGRDAQLAKELDLNLIYASELTLDNAVLILE